MRGLEEKIRDLVKQLEDERRLGDKRAEQFYGLPKSVTADPPNITNGSEWTRTITLTGAALGDFVPMVSFSLDLQGIKLVAFVSEANKVDCIFSNHTGGDINLASGTLRVRVIKK